MFHELSTRLVGCDAIRKGKVETAQRPAENKRFIKKRLSFYRFATIVGSRTRIVLPDGSDSVSRETVDRKNRETSPLKGN